MAPQSVLTVTDHDAVVDVVAAVAAEVARTENPVTHERLLRYAYQFFIYVYGKIVFSVSGVYRPIELFMEHC